jgi:hypothetical protein
MVHVPHSRMAFVPFMTRMLMMLHVHGVFMVHMLGVIVFHDALLPVFGLLRSS